MDAFDSKSKNFIFSNGLRARAFLQNNSISRFIVFVPGGPGISSRYLDRICFEIFSALQINVLLFDLPLHSVEKSPQLSKSNVNFGDVVRLIRESILTEIRPSDCFLVGHSFGALVVNAILNAKSDMIRGGCLISMPYKSGSSFSFEKEKMRLGLTNVTVKTEEDFLKYWEKILPVYFHEEEFFPNI